MEELKEKATKLREVIFNHLSEIPFSEYERYEKYVINEVQLNFYRKIADAKNGNLLDDYCVVQYVIDLTLQIIATRLHAIFHRDQVFLREKFSESFGKKAKLGNSSREYLVHYLIGKRNELSSEVESLKQKFNEIISLAGEIGFQVFDEEEFRYDWYYSLALSLPETYSFFQREGIPSLFLSSFAVNDNDGGDGD